MDTKQINNKDSLDFIVQEFANETDTIWQSISLNTSKLGRIKAVNLNQ